MRGHGVPQSRFAAEVQLDIAAKEMGLDPIDIRLKNALKPGETTPNGFKITSCGLEESITESKRIIARWIEERPKESDEEEIRDWCWLLRICFWSTNGWT